ncbi:hypothetical protein LUW76_33275 [Actinomadura madurae]|uniref:hypothetical protein n=1 Tax=Actinomadura madurae TaxID=1993 RepID=UPI002027222D|nr:hypothetical protein [Actinomadura madurae]URM98815.1 hypothetical protein LUW76_33275 [Actinomadura madurae]
MADAFVAEFVDSTTWRATLAVLESAFPGLGLAATLTRRADDLRRTTDALDRKAAARLGVPAWLDDAGMVFDLSAKLGVRMVRARLPEPARPPARVQALCGRVRHRHAGSAPLPPRGGRSAGAARPAARRGACPSR